MHEKPRDRGDGAVSGLWGRVACAWAVAFAVLHLYWALGGDWGLGVSAGPVSAERPRWFVAVGPWGVGLLCLVGGALGWLLSRPRPTGPTGGVVRTLGWCVCAVLLLRAVTVEVMLLADTAGREITVSPEQRMWTLLLWNPWFLVGGLVFGLAALGFARTRAAASGGS